jgi:hypothetical protein
MREWRSEIKSEKSKISYFKISTKLTKFKLDTPRENEEVNYSNQG